MKSLYQHIDEALRDPDPDPAVHVKPALTHGFFAWLDDRLVHDDVLDVLREALPDLPDDHLLDVAGRIGRAVQQP